MTVRLNNANSSNWFTTKIKFVSEVISGGTPQSSNPDYWDGPVLWLTPVDLGKEGCDNINNSGRTITYDGVVASGLSILPVGSIILSTRAPIGSVGLLACEATTNQGCKAIVPNFRKFYSKFGYYFSIDAAENFQSLGLGTTFIELSTYSLKNFKFNLPEIKKQRHIASYLDQQTAKIDRLMDLRRRQIALLKEQRAALIQQAVTRGLNPNVPMKESGLPWLGEIPAHWEVKKLGLLSKIGNGSTPSRTEPAYWTNGIYPWLNSAVVNQDTVFEAAEFVTEKALKECHLPRVPPQSILIGITGQGKTRGMSAILAFEATINQHIAFITIQKPTLLTNYLQLVINGMYPVLRAISEGEGSTKGALTCEDLKKIKLPLPSTQEQSEIIRFLEQKNARFDQLADAYSRQLTLLAEYRAALIHEYVTGQRPVPNHFDPRVYEND